MNNQLIVYLSLGSNIEDRVLYLKSAREKLEENTFIHVLGVSSIYETEPWTRDKMHKNQTWFLNQVIKIETSLSAQELLTFTQSLENQLGRIRSEHWGARTIDIDILLYGDKVIESSNLHIPHPFINTRKFVLIPLLEIEPDIKNPISNTFYADILKKCNDEHKVGMFQSN